jgi:hypothetical protein
VRLMPRNQRCLKILGERVAILQFLEFGQRRPGCDSRAP